MKQFTFTITDPTEARRLEEHLRENPRIYTRTRRPNSSQHNVNTRFEPTRITVSDVRVISEGV
jgi:hypothetical protein